MRRKIARTLIILVGIVILASVSLAWYGIRHPRQQNPPLRRPGEEYGLQYREPGEIVIEDLGATKRVTDRRQGYSVEVPKEWKVEEPDTAEAILYLYDTVNRCDFSIGVFATDLSVDEQIKKEEESHDYLTIQRYEVSDIQVAEMRGKRVVLESAEFGYSESVLLQQKAGILDVALAVHGNDRELCRKEFDSLLTKISL